MKIANRAGGALLGAALVLLIFVVVVFRKDASNYQAMQKESEHLHEVIDAGQDALSALKDAETGQRGFIITGRDIYLEPYTSGLRDYTESLSRLRSLTAADPAISDLVRRLAEFGGRKLSELAYTVDLVKAHDRKAAVDRVGEDIGKQFMDRARAIGARIDRDEEAARTRQNLLIAQAGDKTRTRVVMAAMGLFLLTLGGTLLLRIEVRHERAAAVRLEASERKYRDLSESLEREVEERTSELRFLNSELSAFSYSVSHDLRAPLRSIDGFSQMIVEDYSDRLDAAGLDMLKRIRNAARRMGDLIQSLLELSRVTRIDLRREKISLSCLSESIVESLRAASPDRRAQVLIAPDLTTEADPELARVILDNLLANAWKFTRHTEGALIEVARSANGPTAEFIVRDNGAGFDSRHADRLFAPFQRLHAETEFEGTGIGLATVQRAIHRHGGTIRAESEPGRGAAFFFTLA